MKRLLLSVVMLLSMLVTALPAHAAGAETLHFSFKGQEAEAVFISTDPSGCVETFVDVFAVDGRTKFGPGQPTAESVAFLFISEFDVCNDVQLVAADGFAILTPDQFQIDKQITAATLNATIEVFDFVSNTTFPVDVSISWVGEGPTTSVKDHFQVKAPGFKVNSRANGTFRDATASGTVSDGTTNFTPEPAVFAELASIKQGEVAIIHE